jgi:biopolymer transport protein ExbB
MVRPEKVRCSFSSDISHAPGPVIESGQVIEIDREIAAVFVEISDSAGRISAMRRFKWTRLAMIRATAGVLLALVVASPRATAQAPQSTEATPTASARASGHSSHGTDSSASLGGDELRAVTARLERIGHAVTMWYRRTPPAERVTWGGMIACCLLGVLVVLERLVKLRRHKITPRAFTARFLDRLHDGKLECGQALDLCELNPSPAANVALAAVRRWGRPAGDLERAVALAHRVETDRLRRNVGTLRRIAVLTPLLGLLGTLFALGRALEGESAVASSGSIGTYVVAAPGPPLGWGRALAATLTPLSAGIVIATLSLIAYDALLIRIEKLAGGLDRLGAETIDAIAVAAPLSTPTMALAQGEPRPPHLRPDPDRSRTAGATRSPHQPYFRLDDGSGMIRHPGEHSSGQ